MRLRFNTQDNNHSILHPEVNERNPPEDVVLERNRALTVLGEWFPRSAHGETTERRVSKDAYLDALN